jgi:O-succinylbenzoic acid--CoA ligase
VAALRGGSERQAQTIPDWLRWRSGVSPDALALKVGALEWSYRELQERVSALSAALLARGVERGDRVAILMPASERYVALVHALARVGAVAVPLNHRQSTPELLSQLWDSDPSLVVHEEALGAKSREPVGPEPGHGRGGRPPSPRRWARASELMTEPTSGSVEPVVGDRLDASSPHAIVYTSGSSGAPKGVALTLSNLMWNAISVGFRSGAYPRDRWLLCLPLFHVGGYAIIFRAVLHGSGIVVHQKFDPGLVSRSLDSDGITLASFVPTMLSEVLEARGGKPLDPRVRLIFLGGGQPPAPLVAAIRKRRLPVLLTYGMTETCSQVAVSKVLMSSEGPAYQAILPSEVAVVRPATKGRVSFAEPGEVGEVAVRGPTLFRGYWRKPALTRARFNVGWFFTGDLGILQPSVAMRGGAAGGITILGRKEETIVSGGEKVFPAEVESALREHPAVKDAVVVGVGDAKWGQRVVAVVEAKTQLRKGPPPPSELSAFLRERIGAYKIPKQYYFWTALPRTHTGKTRRAAVRLLLLERGEDPS